MAKVKRNFGIKKTGTQIAFTKANFIIFIIGLILLLLGYIALAQGPATSYSSLSVAPVLLVIAYCVIIPLAILYRTNSEEK